jgi:hypothetical protein
MWGLEMVAIYSASSLEMFCPPTLYPNTEVDVFPAMSKFIVDQLPLNFCHPLLHHIICSSPVRFISNIYRHQLYTITLPSGSKNHEYWGMREGTEDNIGSTSLDWAWEGVGGEEGWGRND